MVTDGQVRLLRSKMSEGKNQEAAAAAAGMSVRTARKWQRGPLPSQTRSSRDWRTRSDPFKGIWETVIEPLLKVDEDDDFEAKRLMQLLVDRDPERFSMRQLRTMQRRVRDWRAVHGEDKEVCFQQDHPPGKEVGIDFTCCNELGVTIGGEPFDHMLFEFVLVASTWTSANIAYTETFEALVEGLQTGLWRLGGVPKQLCLDNMSAATKELKKGGGRSFNKRFLDVCDHLGFEMVRKINVKKPRENGATEVRHGRTKKLLVQEMHLRGSRDFESIEAYGVFVQETIEHCHNRHIANRLEEERVLLRPLPAKPVPIYTRVEPRVRRWSTVRVCSRAYSVPSRLIGYIVEIRLYPTTVELRYRGQLLETFARLRGDKMHRIDYRHIIHSLVRKPGAFANYRYREELYPTLVFRRAYDALVEFHGERAHVEYLRILKLAAETMESDVEATLQVLLASRTRFDYVMVESRVRPRQPVIPMISIAQPDLTSYDALLGGAA